MRFKRHKKEGPYRAFQRTIVDIIDKGKVGQLEQTSENQFLIRLMVKKPEHPGWGWITLKRRLDKEADARDYVRKWWQELCAKYDLHRAEP